METGFDTKVDSPVINSLKHDLNHFTSHRVEQIKWFEKTFIRGERPFGVKTEAQMLKAARKYAVERVLGFERLNKIDDEAWDRGAPSSIVSYLAENYESELRLWISDTGRLKLDPPRVEAIEREVEKVFDIKRKR
jgi:hypothetical protein